MNILAPLLFSLIFGAVGGFMCRAAIVLLRKEREKLAISKKAEGVVIAMKEDHSDSDTVFRYPVVKFTAVSGTEFEIHASVRTEPPRHKVGDRVTIAYDPADPGSGDIAGTETLGLILLLLLGIPFLLAGIGVLSKCVFMQACGPVQ